MNRAVRPASLYLRILLAWLLAMQPMIAGYAAASVAAVPHAAGLCSGGTAPTPDAPAGMADHRICCLVCAAPALAGPPLAPELSGPAGPMARPAPRAHDASRVLGPAGFGPQAARAPPL